MNISVRLNDTMKEFSHYKRKMNNQNINTLKMPLMMHHKVLNNMKVYCRKTRENLNEILPLIVKILVKVQSNEPRFVVDIRETKKMDVGYYENSKIRKLVSKLHDHSCPYENIKPLSQRHFHMIIYLNQMGVFNVVDNTSSPGYASLKLSESRKRSMSLWVEFVTASGYLSASKLRYRFRRLVKESIENLDLKNEKFKTVKLDPSRNDVYIHIDDKYSFNIVIGFDCDNFWPKQINGLTNLNLPSLDIEKKGFSLISNEMSLCSFKDTSSSKTTNCDYDVKNNLKYKLSKNSFVNRKSKNQHSIIGTQVNMIDSRIINDGDDWFIDFSRTQIGQQLNCIVAEKTVIFVQHFITSQLKAFILLEREKHPDNHDWQFDTLGFRINGTLLQIINHLQNRKLCHTFFPSLNKVVDFYGGNCTFDIGQYNELAAVLWTILRGVIIGC